MYFDDNAKGYLTHDNLYLLFRLRNIALIAQSTTILTALIYLQMDLPILPILSVIALLCLFNIFTRSRLKNPRPLELKELSLQLSIDILALTILLGLSGGGANPFAILYLLPLTIAAILLPTTVIWGLALLTVVCYSAILLFYVPMPFAHNHSDAFNLHIVGMWIGFVLSAGVIAYFIVGLRKVINLQAEALNKARDEAVRNEQLVKLGVLAASTAHEMGTPLNSMALLIEDIEYDTPVCSPTLLKTTATLREQIARCQKALTTLTRSTGSASLLGGQQTICTDYLQRLISDWQQAHPNMTINLQVNDQAKSTSVMIDEVLNLALTNIIDNAAQVSSARININAQVNDKQWNLTIRDFGPGLTNENKNKVATQGYSTKPHGLGLGLFLSHSVIERLGGMVELYNHQQGGLCTHITLPTNFSQSLV